MKKVILIFLASVLVIIVSVFVRHYFISSFYRKHLISETISGPLLFRNDAGSINLMELKGKYILLYFWNPAGEGDGESLEKYREMCSIGLLKTDSRIRTFTVQCDPDSAPGTTEAASPETGGIPVPALSLSENSMLEQLKINALPTVLIIGPEWEIKFRGSSLDAALKCMGALTYETGAG
jgi:hypothetical protein